MGERLQDADLNALTDAIAEQLGMSRARVIAALSKALKSDVEPLQAVWPPEVETR